MRGIFERVRQFREAGQRPEPADYALAREILGHGELYALFAAQEPRDVVHAVKTARWLVERGIRDETLLMAALLHDVGKGAQRTRDRVGWVVAKTAGLGGLMASAGSRWELRRAMARTACHADVGAAMLEAAGASERVVAWTRLHHERAGQDDMLRMLQAADAAS